MRSRQFMLCYLRRCTSPGFQFILRMFPTNLFPFPTSIFSFLLPWIIQILVIGSHICKSRLTHLSRLLCFKGSIDQGWPGGPGDWSIICTPEGCRTDQGEAHMGGNHFVCFSFHLSLCLCLSLSLSTSSL